MLNQQTIEKLYGMRMRGMADGFRQQQEDPQTTHLSFEERFALLVDRQWNWRQNRALERPACLRRSSGKGQEWCPWSIGQPDGQWRVGREYGRGNGCSWKRQGRI